MADDPTEVQIFGSVYHLRGETDAERLRELARVVDETMREVAQRVSTADTARIAILAAVNLADELLQMRQQQEGERVQIQERMAELAGELSAELGA